MDLCSDIKQTLLEDLAALGYDVHSMQAPIWPLDRDKFLTPDGGTPEINPDTQCPTEDFAAAMTRRMSYGDPFSYEMILEQVIKFLDEYGDKNYRRWYIYGVFPRMMSFMENDEYTKKIVWLIRLDGRDIE